jgi:flagellar hook-length control protein FliK
MSQTNIDTLFQAVAAPADRKLNATRTSGDTSGFDDHLSQASSTVFDVARPEIRGDSPSIYSSSNCETPPINSSVYCGQSANGTEESQTPVCPPAPPHREQTTETDSSAAQVEAGEDPNDTPADEATALAGVAQSTDIKSTDKPEPKPRNADHDGSVRAKAAIAAKEKTKPQVKAGTHVDSAPAKSDLEANAVDVKLPVVESEKITLADTKEFIAEEIEQDDNGAASAKQTKKVEQSAVATKHSSEHESASGDDQSTHPTSAAKAADVDMTNGEQAAAQSKAEAVANMKATKKGDTERSSDDDSSREGTTPARGNSQNDAATSATKAAATVVANGVAANMANTTDKDAAKESSDKSTKPVGVKTDNVIGTLSRASRAAADFARGTRETDSNDLPRIDPTRFVGRVAKAFQTANERGGTLQLRLSPPELGALRIQLTVKDGVMSAALETDNSNARKVLLDHLPALRDRLAEQNIRIERFDVDVRQENNGGQANPHESNQHQYQQQREQAGPRAARSQQRASEMVLPELPETTPQISSTGINLFV